MIKKILFPGIIAGILIWVFCVTNLRDLMDYSDLKGENALTSCLTADLDAYRTHIQLSLLVHKPISRMHIIMHGVQYFPLYLPYILHTRLYLNSLRIHKRSLTVPKQTRQLIVPYFQDVLALKDLIYH